MATPIILADGFGIKLCDQLGINPKTTTRVIIDIRVDKPVIVYVEEFATKEMLAFDLPEPRFIKVIKSKGDD